MYFFGELIFKVVTFNRLARSLRKDGNIKPHISCNFVYRDNRDSDTFQEFLAVKTADEHPLKLYMVAQGHLESVTNAEGYSQQH